MVMELSFTAPLTIKGKVLDGTLNLHASASVRANRLDVYFRGKEHTRVTHGDKTTFSKQQFVRLDHHNQVSNGINQTIRRNGQKLPKGSYQIPFSFRLPPTLPSSCSFQKDSSNATIEYCLRAVLRGSGKIQDYQTRHEVHVVAQRKTNIIDTVPRSFPPFSHSIRSWGFIHQGRLVGAARAKDTKLVPGQRLEVDLAMVNLSRVSVHRVQTILVEEAEWSSDSGHKNTQKRNLVSQTFPVTTTCGKKLNAQQFKETLKDQNLKARNFHLVANRLANNGSSNNSEDEVMHLSIPPVPIGAHNTHSGSLITIRHSLVVYWGGSNNSLSVNPLISIPVHIVHGQRSATVVTPAAAAAAAAADVVVSASLQETMSLPIASSVQPIYDQLDDEVGDAPTIIATSTNDDDRRHAVQEENGGRPQIALALTSRAEPTHSSDHHRPNSLVAVPVRT